MHGCACGAPDVLFTNTAGQGRSSAATDPGTAPAPSTAPHHPGTASPRLLEYPGRAFTAP